jgi:hypothetical protein
VGAASLYKINTVIKLKVKANDGPDLVYRPQGECYNPQYTSKCSAVVVCLSTVGAGSLTKGLEFSII